MLLMPRRPLAALVLSACLMLALALRSTSAWSVDPGQPAPEFSLSQADGKPLHLSALRGKVVYVDFWASWCAPCRRSFPWMNAMHDKYAANGLVVVGINVDQRKPDAEKFLAQVPAKFAIAFDTPGDSPKAYGIRAMPSSVLIDAHGRVVAVHAGFRDEDREQLEAKIRAALSPRAN